MIESILLALFAGSALLAVGVIAESLRRHGAAALALRDQVRACGEYREFRHITSEVRVRPIGSTIVRRQPRRVSIAPRPAVRRCAQRAAA